MSLKNRIVVFQLATLSLVMVIVVCHSLTLSIVNLLFNINVTFQSATSSVNMSRERRVLVKVMKANGLMNKDFG